MERYEFTTLEEKLAAALMECSTALERTAESLSRAAVDPDTRAVVVEAEAALDLARLAFAAALHEAGDRAVAA